MHFHRFLLVLLLAFVFGVKTKGLLNAIFFQCFKTFGVAFWKISLVDDRLDSLLLIDLGNSLKITFGWLELLFMYTGWLSGFLYGSKVLLHKSKVMPKKFIKCKLTLMVTLSPASVNTLMMFSLLFQFLEMINLSILLGYHLYITQLSGAQKVDLIAVKYNYQLIHIPLLHWSNLSEHQNTHFPSILPMVYLHRIIRFF